MRKKLSDSRRFGYLFILPALIFMLAFIGYPVVYNIILSLQDVNVMTINLPDKEKLIKKFCEIEEPGSFYLLLCDLNGYPCGKIRYEALDKMPSIQ